MTADLNALGVTPEHQDSQEALDVLADRLDKALEAMCKDRTDVAVADYRVADAAWREALVSMQNAAWDRWMGDDCEPPSDQAPHPAAPIKSGPAGSTCLPRGSSAGLAPT